MARIIMINNTEVLLFLRSQKGFSRQRYFAINIQNVMGMVIISENWLCHPMIIYGNDLLMKFIEVSFNNMKYIEIFNFQWLWLCYW